MLQSVKGLVDEIVAIVDERTTDETADIVRRYGGKVYFEPFRYSFSELRNLAIERSSYLWIFVLDGDEYASDELRANLRRLIETEDYDGYRFPRFNFHNPQVWPDKQLRLFMCHGRWKYRVHEVVTGLRRVLDTPYVIYHDPRGKDRDLGPLYVELWEMDRREGLRREPYPSRYRG